MAHELRESARGGLEHAFRLHDHCVRHAGRADEADHALEDAHPARLMHFCLGVHRMLSVVWCAPSEPNQAGRGQPRGAVRTIHRDPASS